MFLPRIIFITHATSTIDYVRSAEIALEGGIRFIQYRHKPPITDDVLRAEAKLIAELCRQYGAVFTVNDNVWLAREIGADGVHVGLTDMSVEQARLLMNAGSDGGNAGAPINSGKPINAGALMNVRDSAIVGGTANTFEDISRHAEQGVSYVGLGPFRFTETKKNLSPILGLSGYRDIVEQCHKKNINTPIYAIGGIHTEDIPALMKTGIYGIAVSSLILQSENPITTARETLNPQLFFAKNKQSVIK
ncbi:MAG: thiamine phosphate synthase [Bacteroidales bacterium]|jgi:thiamine-phosphate pyrophosphorylase|nr:thiamine phosphate synthase [Bacteroidales bacterium]